MNAVNRVIVLAAGKSLQLDGVSKVLIRHPATGHTILQHIIDAFIGKEITVVVGFRAVQIMQEYPRLHYVHNADWALTNNAMSLGLALDDRPTYVVSGDIFVAPEIVQRMDAGAEDLVLVSDREKRSLSAIHCVLDQSGNIRETYQGPLRNIMHPEAVGLFKITNTQVLRTWRHQCIEHSNLFAAQLLPCTQVPIKAHELQSGMFFEVNTPVDYLELMMASRK